MSGADPDETLTVMEGDSVTLHTGLTEILNDHTIVWIFVPNSSLISQITRKKTISPHFLSPMMWDSEADCRWIKTLALSSSETPERNTLGNIK